MSTNHTMPERNVARYQKLRDSTGTNIADSSIDAEANAASQNQSHKPEDRFCVADAAEFQSFKQTLTLCRTQILQWVLTAILIGFVFATIMIYERKGNMSSRQKSIFQQIITALSIGLGLNFFVRHHAHARRHVCRLTSP